MPRPGAQPGSLLKRLLWFVALWLGGVTALAIIAWALRQLIAAQGSS